MLTDYHLHLRPDRLDAATAEYFTPAGVERYREVADERGIAELGVSEHVHRSARRSRSGSTRTGGRPRLDELEEFSGFVREQTDLRLGLEATSSRGARTGSPI